VEGSVVAMGGGVFFPNRIDDAFAVVDTEAPKVDVLYENRPIGTTNASGKLLVTGLRSFQKNKLAIDTANLPVDAEVDKTEDSVAPADRSGVLVKFPVRTDAGSAVVVFTAPDGTPLPAGARGKIDNGDAFTVGYDGRAYVKGLKPKNVATVTLPDRQCQASFPYQARPGEQVVVSPVVCQ
jgi:outer membrane usher protein